MTRAEFKNGPSLTGWALGAVAGIMAFAVCVVVGQFDLVTSAFIAGVLALVVGAILGLPAGDAPVQAAAPAVPAAKPVQPVAAAVEAPVEAPAAAEASPFLRPVASAAPSALNGAAPAAAVEAAEVGAAEVGAAAGGPVRLSAPRGGVADNLQEIEGIGPALEKLCHDLGFFHFDQIAAWTDADVAWVDQNMGRFKGRIGRDKWVAQARIIVTEGLEVFRTRAQTNDY